MVPYWKGAEKVTVGGGGFYTCTVMDKHYYDILIHFSALRKQEQPYSHPVIRYPLLALEKVTNWRSVTSPARGRSVYSGSGGQGMESSLILVKDHHNHK